jgi:hypothetical protein
MRNETTSGVDENMTIDPHLWKSRGFLRVLPVLAIAGTLAGCADPCCIKPSEVAVVTTPAIVTTPLAPVPSVRGTVENPAKFMAVGYGSQGSYTQYNIGQQKLMAMRAAQVDAYRSLAEQVHGFRVWGNTAVSAFVTQNDSVRTYVDSFIRGARIVSMTSIGDGNFEATVELTLPPDFIECVRLTSQCTSLSAKVSRTASPRVVTSVVPVVAPSVIYTSP